MSASSPPPTRIWRIAGEHDGYRKIITTPEGFDKKVLPAMHELEIPVYKDYFLLFDECEKAIQDVGYRGDIYLPVEDFFKFENKAMVSATPIVPSDPRFEENGFKILKLVPTYDSRIELTLCTTNNTVAVMRKLLKRLENETVCVFLNSTETILSLIYALRLQGRSRVFCSEKSVRKLKQMNFTDASETLDELAPVNFLTSRFYAAVDIKLDYKPHVILLTDVMRAPFSAVDPQTEVVQAIGRFRNGVARAYHIANTSDNLQCLTREALERRLTGEENIYNQIRQIQPDGEDEAQARFQALNGMAYKRFVTRDGNRNHFMWDNAWTDEQIKAYYRYPSTLTAAYKSAPFRLTVCTAHYPITDADRLRREKAKMNTRELWREVVGQLAKLQTAHSDMEPAFLQEELGNEFAAIVQAFTILGAKRMEELGYSRSKIEAAMTRTEENVLLTLFAKKHSNGKLVTKVNRLEFDDILAGLDLGSVVYPKYMTCDYIVQYVRALQNEAGNNIKTLYRILDDRVEALEFTVHEESAATGVPLSQLHLKKNLLLCCITRGSKILIPRGGDQIQVGDNVIVVTLEHGLHDLRDIVEH